MKKTYLYGLVFILMITSVMGNGLLDDVIYYWEFDDATATLGGYDFSATGSPTYITGKIGDALDCEVNNYLTQTGSMPLPTVNFTYNVWQRVEAATTYNGVFSRISAGGHPNPVDLHWYDTGTDVLNYYRGDGSSNNVLGYNYAIDGNWHMFTIRKQGSNISIYVDGVSVASETTAQTIADDSSRDFRVCQRQDDVVTRDGHLDELGIWNASLNDSQISDLYNSGSGLAYSSFTETGAGEPPTPETNNSIESVTHYHQEVAQIKKSTSYTPIFSGSFNASGGAQLYASWVSNIQFLSANPSSVTCRLTIDGVEYGDAVIRSNTGTNNYASIGATTTNFSYPITGQHNATFECLGSSNQNFEISNTDFIIHQLIDNNGLEINHKFVQVSDSFNETSFTELGEILFNTTNTTLSYGKTRSILVEIPVSVNYTTTNNITGQIVIGNTTNNQTCADNKRFGSIGSAGIGGSYCMWTNAPGEQEIFIKIFGKGNGAFSSNVVIKEFITSTNETEYTTIPETTLSDTTYTNVSTINLNTTTSQSGVTKFAASVEGSTAQQMDFRIINSVNGSEMFRSVSNPNQAGVVLMHEVFNTLTGAQKFTIQAKTDTGTLKINEADFLSYFSTSKPFLAYNYNITIYNAISGAQIFDFTATDSKGNIYSSDVGAGVVTIPQTINPDNITLSSVGYANITYSLNTSQNHNLSIYSTNSFDIEFLNEANGNRLNTSTIYLDLISDLYANNYSTTNGTLYIDLLTPETYTFRYYGTGFQPRLSTFTLTNNTYNEITLYLLSGGQNVTLYVYDVLRQPVENAQIKIYRYSTASNSYILMNTINTDFEGKAITNLQLNSEFYRFYIYYNSELKLSTSPAYVTGTEIEFTINLEENILENYFTTTTSYTSQCAYNKDSSNFRFYYDTNGEASQGCLKVYYYTATSEVLETNSCQSSSSATILVSPTNVSGRSYIARGFITNNDGTTQLCESSHTFINSELKTNNLGFIIVIFLLFVSLFLFAWSLPLAFISLPLPLIYAVIIGLVDISLGVAIGIEVIGIVLAIIVSRR